MKRLCKVEGRKKTECDRTKSDDNNKSRVESIESWMLANNSKRGCTPSVPLKHCFINKPINQLTTSLKIHTGRSREKLVCISPSHAHSIDFCDAVLPPSVFSGCFPKIVPGFFRRTSGKR